MGLKEVWNIIENIRGVGVRVGFFTDTFTSEQDCKDAFKHFNRNGYIKKQED